MVRALAAVEALEEVGSPQVAAALRAVYGGRASVRSPTGLGPPSPQAESPTQNAMLVVELATVDASGDSMEDTGGEMEEPMLEGDEEPGTGDTSGYPPAPGWGSDFEDPGSEQDGEAEDVSFPRRLPEVVFTVAQLRLEYSIQREDMPESLGTELDEFSLWSVSPDQLNRGRYKLVQECTLGKQVRDCSEMLVYSSTFLSIKLNLMALLYPVLLQVDVVRAFIGFCYYVMGEKDTPPSLALYQIPLLVAKLVVYLKARGVGR